MRLLFPFVFCSLFLGGAFSLSGQNCSAVFTGTATCAADPYGLYPTLATFTANAQGPQYIYTWSGGNIVSGAGTSSIEVSFPSPGNQTITLDIYDQTTGCSDLQSVTYFIDGGLTGPVQGPDTVCIGDTVRFTRDWYTGLGSDIRAGAYDENATPVGFSRFTPTNQYQTYDTLDLVWLPGSDSAYIIFEYFRSLTSCTRYGKKDIVLLGVLRGPDMVCTGDTVQYEMLHGVAVNNWTVTGGTIVSGQGTNILEVVWPTSGAGTVECSWVCPGKGNRTAQKSVQAGPLVAPVISGPDTIFCPSTNNLYTYSTSGIPAVTYTWAPQNFTATGGLNGASLDGSPDSLGNIVLSLTATLGHCSATATDTFYNALPITDIVGNFHLCGNTTETYYLAQPSGNPAPTWNVTGGTLLGAATGDTIVVAWGSSGYGNIDVVSNLGNCNFTLTEAVTIYPEAEVDLGIDQYLCPGVQPGATFFDANGPTGPSSFNISYLNSNGFNFSYVNASGFGPHWLEKDVQYFQNNILMATCSDRDTAFILPDSVLNPLNIGPDTLACPLFPETLDAGAGFSTYQWSNGPATQTTAAASSGTYTVTVTSLNGCTYTDDIVIVNAVSPGAPELDLGPTTQVCPGDTFFLFAGNTYSNYVWNTGDTTPSLGVTQTGVYSVSVTGGNCTLYDDVLIQFPPQPPLDLGPDTTICVNTSALLVPGSGFSSYAWSTGATGPSLLVSSPGTYSVTVNSGPGCVRSDTIDVFMATVPPVDLGPDRNICPDTTTELDAGVGFSNIFWSNASSTPSITVGQAGSYWIQAFDSFGCLSRDTVEVFVLNDCVWPGDANHDGVANNVDLLNVGVAFGSSGFSRTGATPAWYGQPAPNWSQSFTGGANYKHADGDGNATINDNDTLPIIQNYGLTHNKTGGTSATGIPLFLVPHAPVVHPGDTVRVDVVLGSDILPANDVYGSAWSILVDPALHLNNGVSIRYPSSFLGTKGMDMISLWVPDVAPGQHDLALARTDQTSRNGHGTLATLEFALDAAAFAGQDTGYFPIQFQNLQLVDPALGILQVAPQDTTVMVVDPALRVEQPGHFTMSIRPNPAHQVCQVSFPAPVGTEAQLEVVDLRGKVLQRLAVATQGGWVNYAISLDNLSDGIYLLRARTETGTSVGRLTVQH